MKSNTLQDMRKFFVRSLYQFYFKFLNGIFLKFLNGIFLKFLKVYLSISFAASTLLELFVNLVLIARSTFWTIDTVPFLVEFGQFDIAIHAELVGDLVGCTLLRTALSRRCPICQTLLVSVCVLLS